MSRPASAAKQPSRPASAAPAPVSTDAERVPSAKLSARAASAKSSSSRVNSAKPKPEENVCVQTIYTKTYFQHTINLFFLKLLRAELKKK